MDSHADIEVFSSAEAVVSDDFLDLISEDKLSFFNHICSVAQVNIICNTTGNFTAQGSWKKIVALEDILKTSLRDSDRGVGSKFQPSVTNYLSSDETSNLSQTKLNECYDKEEEVNLKTSALGRSDLEDSFIDTYDSDLRTNKEDASRTNNGNNYAEPGNQCMGSVKQSEDGNEIYVNITLSTCNDLSVESSVPASVSDVPLGDCVNLPRELKCTQSKEECDNALQPSNKSKSEKDRRKIYEQQAPYKFFCNFCSFKSKRESHYKKHILLHKQENAKLYVCSQCGFRTLRMGHLRRHELQHASEALSCTLCSYTTDNLFFLQRHHRLKHSSATKEQTSNVQEYLHCQHCSYKTTQPHFLKRHLRVHQCGEDASKRSSTLYQCEKCNYMTWRKEHFERHQRDVHSEVRPFLCDTCGKAFKRADALRAHRVSRHHPSLTPGQDTAAPHSASSTPPLHCCPQCSKPCRSRAHLKDHMAAHSDERSFLCELCGSSFKTRAVQRKHIATVHANPKAFPCNHCVRRFSTKYALLRHNKIHGLTKVDSPAPEVISSGETRVLESTDECPKLEKVITSHGYVSETDAPSRPKSCKEGIPCESERLGNIEKLQEEVPGSSVGTEDKDEPFSVNKNGNNDSRGCAVVIGMDGETQSVSGGILTRTPAPSETTTALLYLTTDFTHYR